MTNACAAQVRGEASEHRPPDEDTVPGCEAIDHLLAAWNRWQDLRATGAPVGTRLKAYEAYLAARARLPAAPAAAPEHARATSDTSGIPGGGPPAPSFRRFTAAVAAGILALVLLAVIVGVAGAEGAPEATAGGREPVAAVLRRSEAPRGPNLQFAPGP